MTQDGVARLLCFKQRCPTVKSELAPNEFAATIPGQERMWTLSLSKLMDKLERWEREQEAAP